MNIFVLDQDPKVAARYHCDKHVVKMVLETAQILSTVLEPIKAVGLYSPTHKNHPCTKWASASSGNFSWLVELGFALGDEYTKRYGKTHKSMRVIDLAKSIGSLSQSSEMTQFALAMPDVYRSDCPVKSYREYYKNDKKHIAVWNYSETPT